MWSPVAIKYYPRFGLFEVDLDTRELRKSGLRIKLQGQPFQILIMLLSLTGAIVTRGELQKTLWPSDTFVDFDLSLNSAVKKLRQALNDDSENPRFVAALYRRGYRFIRARGGPGCVEQIQSLKNGIDSAAPAKPIVGPARKTRRAYLTAAAIFALAALVAAIAFFWPRAPLAAPRVLSTAQLTSDNLPKDLVVTDGPRVYFGKL